MKLTNAIDRNNITITISFEELKLIESALWIRSDQLAENGMKDSSKQFNELDNELLAIREQVIRKCPQYV